jgi:hypothetical protein
MTTPPHAFIAMPFGVKPGIDGGGDRFQPVYGEYIAPALEAAGLEAFRADEGTRRRHPHRHVPRAVGG